MENKEQNKGSGKVWMILFILSLLFNIYQWRNTSNTVTEYQVITDSLVTARVDVEKELGETYAELSQYKGINAELDSLLAEANAKVEASSKRIDQLIRQEKNSGKLNDKLKQELAELRKLKDEYLAKIDELLLANQKLTQENQNLTGTVANLTKNLETTVGTASVLKSEYFKVAAYKRRGSDKYVSTAMAKRANKLDVCFDVMDNKIARAGEKKVYLRITEPGGKVLGDRSSGSASFKMAGSGEDVMYTASSAINYDNAKQNVCMSYEEPERVFAAGTYLIEVYVDGVLSGASSYVLR